jgi:hypothetical protein
MVPCEESIVHKGETHTTPEEAGFLPERLDQLDTHLLELIAQDRLQGASYLLARHGQVFAHRSMGKLKCGEDSPPLMPDSIRRVASITKAFAAVAIMQLVEDDTALDYEDTASVTVRPGYRFDAWLQPAEATTSVGAPVTKSPAQMPRPSGLGRKRRIIVFLASGLFLWYSIAIRTYVLSRKVVSCRRPRLNLS